MNHLIYNEISQMRFLYDFSNRNAGEKKKNCERLRRIFSLHEEDR